MGSPVMAREVRAGSVMREVACPIVRSMRWVNTLERVHLVPAGRSRHGKPQPLDGDSPHSAQELALVTLPGMPIEIDIAHVARLARLGLSPELLARYGSQLEVILEHAAKVQEADTEGVEPTAHPLGLTNAFRPDVVRPSLDRAEVLAQAPDATETHFRVPPALEQE